MVTRQRAKIEIQLFFYIFIFINRLYYLEESEGRNSFTNLLIQQEKRFSLNLKKNLLYLSYNINKGVSGCTKVFLKTPKDSLPYNIVAKVNYQGVSGCTEVFLKTPKYNLPYNIVVAAEEQGGVQVYRSVPTNT